MDEHAIDDATTRVERSFFKLGAAWKQASRSQAGQIHPELRPAGWIVFRVVVQSPAPVSVAEIIAETGTDKSVVSRQLKALREWGLVELERDEADARVVLVRSTDLGRERAAQLKGRMRDRYRSAFATWADGDVDELARLLEQLVPAIEVPLREAAAGTSAAEDDS